MAIFGRLLRGIALAGVLVSIGAIAIPVFAGPADVALLKSYIGEWRGHGILTGSSTHIVACRLSLTPGNRDQVTYSGRCALAGNILSVKGTMAYIEASHRFEAAMSSNASFTGLAIGRERGNNLVFNLRERDHDDNGKDLNISADITLSADAIMVGFQIVYPETGKNMYAEVPFSRSAP